MRVEGKDDAVLANSSSRVSDWHLPSRVNPGFENSTDEPIQEKKLPSLSS